MSDLLKILGERIRNLRKNRNWSQEDLAHQAGITRSFLGEVERGERNPKTTTLEKIAHGLDISLEELFRCVQPFQPHQNSTKDLPNIIERLYALNEKNQRLALDIITNVLLISEEE